MTDINTSKFLQKMKLSTNSSKKLDDYISKVVKILVVNIIKNILTVKEAVKGKNIDHKITTSDVKETINTMKRLSFYSNMKLSMKGGSYNLPLSYFNPDYESSAYSSPNSHSNSYGSINANSNFIRQPLIDNQFDQHSIPNVVPQQGGANAMKSLNKTMSLLVNKDDITKIIDEMNKKYSKNPIKIESPQVIKMIQDSVNKNLMTLFTHYKLKIDNANVDVSKLKDLVDNDPSLIYMKKTP